MKKDKTKLKEEICILLTLIIIFIVLAILVLNGKTIGFDKIISNFIINKIPESMNTILKVITTVGGTKVFPFVAIGLSILAILLKKKNYGIIIFLNSLLAACAYISIKNIIQRPRPTPFRFIEETGYSFPSGHATSNMALYGMLIYLIWKKLKNKKLKIVLTIILSLWILTVGVSRIYFNVHYASDIIAGFVLGIICIMITTTSLSKKLKI